MWKKFFTMFLAVVVICFFSCISKVSAAYASFVMVDDYYVFENNNDKYYIFYAEYIDERHGGGVKVKLKCIRNGQKVGSFTDYFFSSDGTFNLTSDTLPNKRGYTNSDNRAKMVYNIVTSAEFKQLGRKHLESNSASALYNKAKSLMYAGNYEEAIVPLLKLTGENYKFMKEYHYPAFGLLGICYYQTNNDEKAKYYLGESNANLENFYFYALTNLGNENMKKYFDKAIKYVNDTYELKDISYFLEDVIFNYKDFRNSDLYPNTINAHKLALNKYSQYTSLESRYSYANSVEKRQMHYDLVSAENQYKTALTNYKNAINSFLYRELGIFLAAQGDEKDAVKALKKITFWESAYAVDLAAIYERKGNYKKATTYYKKALKLNPDDKRASAGLERIAKLTKK